MVIVWIRSVRGFPLARSRRGAGSGLVCHNLSQELADGREVPVCRKEDKEHKEGGRGGGGAGFQSTCLPGLGLEWARKLEKGFFSCYFFPLFLFLDQEREKAEHFPTGNR